MKEIMKNTKMKGRKVRRMKTETKMKKKPRMTKKNKTMTKVEKKMMKMKAKKGNKSSTKQKKRGKYKKRNTKTGDEAFVDKYVNSEKSRFKAWLRYSTEHKSLFCVICIEAGKIVRNKWGNREKGCNILIKKSCIQHEKSKKHQQAIAAITQFKLTSFLKHKIPKENAIISNSDILQPPSSYKNLFENVYWVCKEELPIATITSLNSYTKSKLDVEIPEYHLSRKSISKIITAISDVITKELLKDIQNSESIGILIDESKDVSDKEILLLYIRYLCGKTFQAKEVFLNLFHLEKTDSMTIYRAVKEYLVEKNLFNKVKFLCTDGAKAMSSNKNGVAGKFKEDIPGLLSFHCLCHQEALALKHTYKEFSELQNFNKSIFNVISYFDNSPKKIVILQNSQAELEFEGIYKLIRAKEVRWSSFFYDTSRIRELYPAILESLMTISKGSFKIQEKSIAEDIYENIADFNFVFMVHWLSDFLAPICSLNKILQSSTYKLADLNSHVQGALKFLNESYISVERSSLNQGQRFETNINLDQIIKHHLNFKGFHLSNFLDRVKILSDKEAHFTYNDSKENRIYKIKFQKLKAISLKFLVLQAAKFMSTELQGMIPGDGNFYKNFEIFNFVNLLKLHEDEINEYGNNEVWCLAEKYLSGRNEFILEKEFIVIEWYNMKIHILEILRGIESEGNLLSLILQEPLFQNGYEAIIELIKIYSILPCSNSEVERGFSTMKRIKTELRNKLGIGTIMELMMVSLNGVESSKWDSSVSYNRWICLNNIRNLN